MKINRFKFIIVFVLGVLLSIGVITYLVNNKTQEVGIHETELNEEDVTFGYGQGLQVVTKDSTEEEKTNGILKLNSTDETIDIIFDNFNDDAEYIMKILYDFKEIEFEIIGEDKYVNEYQFKTENNIQKKIPIKLPSDIKEDNELHNLTVSFFSGPELYEKELQYQTNSYGISLDYQLKYSDTAEYFQNDLSDYKNPEEELDLEITGLLLNQDFTDFELANFPESYIKSNPMDEITLAYRAGRLEESPERFALVMFLDWEQQLINEKPFKLIEMKDTDKIGYGTFTFTAPKEKGLYEITSIMIPDPNSLRSEENFFPLESSYRFTLEVE